jgi:triphosphoribosyl-dephospho-CoA synthase
MVRMACLADVLSPKPGNVSPGHEFADATVHDFLTSAEVIAPILANAPQTGVGNTVFQAVSATHSAVGHNTNLGITLLLAPLCCVPRSQSLSDGIPTVLDSLSVSDAEWVYQAIAVASPGGLENVKDQDLASRPTTDLRSCMSLAADRDLIAKQYCQGFQEVLDTGLGWLQTAGTQIEGTGAQISWLAVRLMAAYGDSLIARKCGPETSQHVQQQAQQLLHSGWPHSPQGQQLYICFDQFLRSDGHRLNPGTTADMVAAIVFSGLREGLYSVDGPLLQSAADYGFEVSSD